MTRAALKACARLYLCGFVDLCVCLFLCVDLFIEHLLCDSHHLFLSAYPVPGASSV